MAPYQEPLKTHLENIARSAIHSINIRNFDPYSEAWKSYHPDLEYRGDYGSIGLVDTTGFVPIKKMSLAVWLSWLQRITEKSCQYKLEITEITCTNLNFKAGFAAVLCTGKSKGFWRQVTRSFVMVSEFKKDEGDEGMWRVRRLTFMPGFVS